MECLQYFRQSFSDWLDTVGILFYPASSLFYNFFKSRARFGKILSYIRVKDENPVRRYIWFFMLDRVDICEKMCYFSDGNQKKGILLREIWNNIDFCKYHSICKNGSSKETPISKTRIVNCLSDTPVWRTLSAWRLGVLAYLFDGVVRVRLFSCRDSGQGQERRKEVLSE